METDYGRNGRDEVKQGRRPRGAVPEASGLFFLAARPGVEWGE